MQIIRIDSIVTAFIRPAEGVNAGLIHTPGGAIMVDTTSTPAEAKLLLESASASPEEVQLVVNTHSHSDHTWGNQVFPCPILAHRLCLERMKASLETHWSREELNAYLSDLEKSDPQKATGLRNTLIDLHITLPTRVFEERYEGELGGLYYQVIHLGGHTPDLSVVWLPESRILFASDLIFQGRYPYIFNADIPTWITRLSTLLSFGASAIIPGHGVMCGKAEIDTLSDYLQGTWELSTEHVRLGHSMNEAADDPAYPHFPGEKYERLHKENIRYMFEQARLARGS